MPVNTAVAPPLARMAAITARFTPPVSSSTATSGTAAVGASDFESMLAEALGSSSVDATSGASGLGNNDPGAGAEVVRRAEKYQGIPYLWGGTDPSKGLDCSGFLQHVFRSVGVELPRVSRDQARQGTAVASLDQARPGDIVAFGQPVDHIGIYVGDNKMIHAPHTGDVVKISEITRTPTAIRRIVGNGAPSSMSGGSDPLWAAGRSALGLDGAAGAGGTGALAGIVASTPALAPYAQMFAQAGARHGVDPGLLAAVAKVESGGNPNAVSPAGARGLMQFMPGTARGMGVDPLDPASAIDGAARLLSQLKSRLGSVELALAGYNAGEGAVRRHGGIPPYGETQKYVAKVTALAGGAR